MIARALLVAALLSATVAAALLASSPRMASGSTATAPRTVLRVDYWPHGEQAGHATRWLRRGKAFKELSVLITGRR